MSQADEVEVLLLCLKDAIPPIRNFTDTMLRRKIGERLNPSAEEFMAYIQRDRLMMKNEQLAEGARLMNLLTNTMRSRDMPVPTKTILDCMSWLEDAIVHDFDSMFPGYGGGFK